MLTTRSLFLARCILFLLMGHVSAATSHAQMTEVPPPDEHLPAVSLVRPPESSEQPPPRDEPQISVVRPAVRTNATTQGDRGDVILDGSAPAPYSAAGVFLRANYPDLPDIGMRLGGAGGSLRVFDPAGALLLRLQANGFMGLGEADPKNILHLSRNYDGVTSMRINNDYATPQVARSVRFSSKGIITAQLSSLGEGTYGYAGGPNSVVLWNHLAAPMVFGTTDVERMRIHANGNITVGSTADWGVRFGAFEGRDGGFATLSRHDSTVEAAATQSDFAHGAMAVQRVEANVNNGGNVVGTYSSGIRSGSGSSWRAVGVDAFAGVGSAADDTGSVSNAYAVVATVGLGKGSVTNGVGVFVEDVGAQNGWGIYQNGNNDVNFFGGKIGIGVINPLYPLHVIGDGKFTGSVSVNGDVNVDGNIAAKFQDLAEWVPSTEDLAPGTVVTLDPDHPNHVLASARAYDTAVAGVVSAQPGIILGERGPSKEQIATTGRVRVRVDATSGAIRIGDLLVTSDTVGMAMKSRPVEVQGVPMHRPGTLIGKALEPLESGIGEILVLLSLQ